MKVKINEVVDVIEMVDGLHNAYYNVNTNEFIHTGFDYDLDDESTEELDDEFDTIILPTKYEINDYGILEDFIKTVKDDKLVYILELAISGKGAFSRFNKVCHDFNINDDYYKFKDEQYRKIAIKWCEDNDIDYEKKEVS